MSRRMFRYVVRVDDQPHTFDLACGGYSGPLHVAASRGRPGNIEQPAATGTGGIHVVEFWAEHNPDEHDERPRTFQVFGTGQPLPDDAHWVGTCDRTPDGLVWHLYEISAGAS
jgi:hypothetical protein